MVNQTTTTLCLHLELLRRIFISISFQQPKDECLQSYK